MLHITIHSGAATTHESATLAQRLREPLTVTFEEAAQALAQLPRMHFEPDGWFAWTSATSESQWQITGQVYDRGPKLGHVEIKIEGIVQQAEIDELLAAFGWPASPLAFQLVREAVLITESEFLRLAAANAESART